MALQALVVILSDEVRRDRFLSLTGYDADSLRARAGSSEMTLAITDFLTSYEPDLLYVAAQLGLEPADLTPKAFGGRA